MRTQAALLDQNLYWVNRRGQILALADMDDSHLANLIPFLRGNIKTIAAIYFEGRDDYPVDLEDWLLNTALMHELLRRTAHLDQNAWRVIEDENMGFEALTGYCKERHG